MTSGGGGGTFGKKRFIAGNARRRLKGRTCWASREPLLSSPSVMARNSSSVSASDCLSAACAGLNPRPCWRVGTTTAACRVDGAEPTAARLSARAPRAHHAVPRRSVVADAFIEAFTCKQAWRLRLY